MTMQMIDELRERVQALAENDLIRRKHRPPKFYRGDLVYIDTSEPDLLVVPRNQLGAAMVLLSNVEDYGILYHDDYEHERCKSRKE